MLRFPRLPAPGLPLRHFVSEHVASSLSSLSALSCIAPSAIWTAARFEDFSTSNSSLSTPQYRQQVNDALPSSLLSRSFSSIRSSALSIIRSSASSASSSSASPPASSSSSSHSLSFTISPAPPSSVISDPLPNVSPSFYSSNYQLITTSDGHLLREFVPCMYDLAQVREHSLAGIEVSVFDRKHGRLDGIKESSRTAHDSYIRIHYRFTSNPQLRNRYALFQSSRSVRIGRIIEDLDALAADIAYRHTRDPSKSVVEGDRAMSNKKSEYTIVTAALDQVHYFERLDLMEDLILEGCVTYTGKTSIELKIEIGQKRSNSSANDLGHAIFLMVARDRTTYASAPVPHLQALSRDEVRLFDDGVANKERRLSRSRVPNYLRVPEYEECVDIHQLFLQRIKPIEEKHPYRQLPMKETKMASVVVMHGQDRNLHSKMFGGYLMRLAFELGYGTVATCTQSRPILIAMDDINFIHPVDIGSICKFKSTIIYTDPSRRIATVSVELQVMDIDDPKSSKTTNTFFFHFLSKHHHLPAPSSSTASPSSVAPFSDSLAQMLRKQKELDDQFPMVLPVEYEEALLWLEGKRRAKAIEHLTGQEKSAIELGL